MSFEIMGLSRVRNEELIIQESLGHMAEFCDGIIIYDDQSTDHTIEICKSHSKVIKVIQGQSWMIDRAGANSIHRQILLDVGKQYNPHWFFYMDADERIVWDFQGYEKYDAVRMKLYDFYITPEDAKNKYQGNLNHLRSYCGPEYRNIIMMFRNRPHFVYTYGNRQISMNGRILDAGWVRHYGKAISIEQWEETCHFYTKSHFPPSFRERWEKRKGKAVHDGVSDFNRPLVKWEDIVQGREIGVKIN